MSFDTSPLDVLTREFFFWLMYRSHHDQQISDNLSLTGLVRIAGQDPDNRYARVHDGVTLDRAELLSMIMMGQTNFGPATVLFDHAEKELEAKMEIHVDGGFTPALSETFYESREDRHRESKGLKITQDILYVILPELIRAFNSDTEWRDKNRDQYVSDAQQALSQILAKLLGSRN